MQHKRMVATGKLFGVPAFHKCIIPYSDYDHGVTPLILAAKSHITSWSTKWTQ